MRLYMIRHGETAWNKELKLQGQTDVPLNEKGRSLARISGQGMKEIPFDLAYTSPLSRAKETAQIVLGDRQIPLYEDARIREISFGELEGEHVRNAAGEVIVPAFYDFFHRPDQYQPPRGGESIDQLCARTGAFLEELRGREDFFGKTILVSTHGAASRALLSHISGCDRKDFWQGGVPKNCAVSVVELVNGTWIIKEQDKVYYENI